MLNSAIILFAIATLPLCHANGQENLTLTGHIITHSGSQQLSPRFSVKLYPPLNSGKAVLLTNSDYKGDFKFTQLSASSYLLEIYLVKDLVYQEVVELNRDLTREIDLRKKNSGPSQSQPMQAPKHELALPSKD
jgi:hypothetical protein